ncbi:MAG: hypothetical protein PHO44_01470 [Sphaerochaetaceae bacterium]|nr:hypothetical protein [Sphaerochaetaceae bacterium]MDD3163203.1 hypothetical protein [Sphaerochaetaceae bacterium]MDD4006628.1 hypothetical protein [Sphaerochaetaceae bacterium]MDD4397286.1 hypothetical protein [Sphaerochaetaceae bacterium]
MKVVSVSPSPDLCSEAGWYGFDVCISEPMTESAVLALKSLGHLVYLASLKKPFFVLKSESLFIKGSVGSLSFRIGLPYNDSAQASSYARIAAGDCRTLLS